MQFAPPPVVGLQYCCTYSMDVAISRKVMTLSNGNFVVTDNNGNPMFKVKGTLFTLHGRRVLFDASGQPILTLRQKMEGNTSIQTQSMLLGKDKFMVTVYPHIDCAFIVALIVILDEINGGD